jgi:penicillin-binding protein 1A
MQAVCSLTLGTGVGTNPLEMTSAYSTLANGGVHCVPYAITKVLDRNGKAIFKAKPSCKQVIPPDVAAQVTAMLQGVINHGTGTAAQIGRPEAGKTGTGENYQDAWFMGYVPQLCTGVWVGYSSREIPMRGLRVLGGGNAFGGTLAAPIWHDLMAIAVANLPVQNFPTPPPQKSGTVPNVVGMQQADAEKVLTKANFVPQAKQVDSLKPAGTVVAQNPAGGSGATLGSLVEIDVSNGKTPVAIVPNVVGEKQKQAVSDIEAAGFKVQIIYQSVPDKSQAGIVLAQSPKGGARRPAGSTVTIIVGRLAGPP